MTTDPVTNILLFCLAALVVCKAFDFGVERLRKRYLPTPTAPITNVQTLKNRLKWAVEQEDYEWAAQLRDEIAAMERKTENAL